MNNQSIVDLYPPSPVTHEEQALADFIHDQKTSELMRSGKMPNWDIDPQDPKWDLSNITSSSSSASQNPNIWFCPIHSKIPYPPHWQDFLKSLIIATIRARYDIGHPTSSGTILIKTKITRILIDYCNRKSIYKFTNIYINDIKNITATLNAASKSQLLSILEILSNHGILPWFDKKQFKSPRKDRAPISRSDVKLVNWHQIVALADAFKRLETDDSSYQTNPDFDFLRVNVMLANLLATHPCRVSELWRLPSDCELIAAPVEKYGQHIIEDQHDDLDFKYGLVWFPVKGGKAVVKPIPSAVQWVAHRCIEIIRSYGVEARATASFIVENPGIIPIPKHLSHIKDNVNITEKITETDIRLLLGLANKKHLSKHRFWKKNFKKTCQNKVKTHGSDNLYCFETFQIEWWEIFQKEFKKTFKCEWPYVVNHKGYKLRADNALLLFYSNTLDSKSQRHSRLFFDTPSHMTLDHLLSDGQPTMKSIWERLGITLPNGSYPNINTHDLRHFLNTIAQQAGLSEPIIAMWSGRKSLSQNAAYDHRTEEERLFVHGYEVEDYDGLQADDILALQAQKAYQTVTIAPPSKQVLDASQQVLETMKNKSMISISPFGYCIGSLIQEPCPTAMNCLSCDRYFICKGSKRSNDYITSKIKSLENQLGKLEALRNSRRLRSTNLIPLIEQQLKGAKALQADLNSPDIPDGKLITGREYPGTTSLKLSDRVSVFRTQMKQMQTSQKELTDE